MEKTSFYIVADPHYFSPRLKAYGKSYEKYMEGEQKLLAESDAVVRAVFERIAGDAETETVIIPGDLTKNGEAKSREDFIKLLYKLKDSGKQILITTAGHDYNDAPVEYDGDETRVVEGVKRETLAEAYRDFGFSDAVARDERTASYVAELRNGARVLMLNCDGEGGPDEGAFDEPQLEWIKERVLDAKKDGREFFAVAHYPIIPAVPVFEFVEDAKIRDWKKIAGFLADAGVRLIFTGHMHLQSVKRFVSEKGNELYDVCTSSIVGSPARYRKIAVGDGRVDVKSFPVPDFDRKDKEISAEEYMDRRFVKMIGGAVDSALSGGEGAAGFAKRIAKRFVDSAKLKTLGRLLRIKTDESIRDVRLKELIVNIVKNIFAGDAPYTPGTPVYDFFDAALRRFDFILKILNKKASSDGNEVDFRDIILNTIGNDTGLSDSDETLYLELRG